MHGGTGIQTLQSTEGSCGNGAFRWAQALNEATLPSKTHPKVFLAQGFDAQDPAGDSGWPTGVRGCRDFGINSACKLDAFRFHSVLCNYSLADGKEGRQTRWRTRARCSRPPRLVSGTAPPS